MKGALKAIEKEKVMRILHTSDWHIGRTLYGRKRYEEQEAFLNWACNVISDENIDVLLVAGDIFDNTTPSNRAQELYYRFLHRIAGSRRRHIVITSGNHDSPSFLNAPKELLKYLDVHVVGYKTESPADEVIILSDADNQPGLIVCAAPYLRDRDIRTVEPGESVEDKGKKLIEGIRNHYREICETAETIRNDSGRDIPIVAMGHLFTAGGRVIEGDGVRELYVGSLAHVETDIFPECIDYLALGHLHSCQRIQGLSHMRYSGSPIPIGFNEAKQEKKVLLVEFNSGTAAVTEIPVPCFQALESIKGDWEIVSQRIEELKSQDSAVWLEIHYEGEGAAGDIREKFEKAVENTRIELLCVKSRRIPEHMLTGLENEDALYDLNVDDVFIKCMESKEVSDEQRAELLSAYREIVRSVEEDDIRAE